MSAIVGGPALGPLAASVAATAAVGGGAFKTPLDFEDFATSLNACLERGGSSDISRWLDGAQTVPFVVRRFLWLVCATTLSRKARSHLRTLPRGAPIHAGIVRAMRARPPGKAVCFESRKQEFDVYSAILRKYGSDEARADLTLGRVVLLALRNESSTLAHHGRGSYDDRLIVMRRLGSAPQLMTFPICTEPGAQYSERAKSGAHHDARYNGVTFSKSEGNDVNKDGIRDAGRLTAGTYHYYEKPGGHLGDRAFQVKIAQVAQRDSNGDGRFTVADANRVDRAGAGTSMYIHRGGEDVGKGKNFEANTWSAGCQTIPKNRYKTFLSSIPIPTSFYYVLVDAAC